MGFHRGFSPKTSLAMRIRTDTRARKAGAALLACLAVLLSRLSAAQDPPPPETPAAPVGPRICSRRWLTILEG